MKIAIIGGGISGLTTAFYLKKFSPINTITVFDADEKLGGKLKTVQKFGFTIENSALGFSKNSSEIISLLKAAGIDELTIDSSDESTTKYFFDGIATHKLPSTFSELLSVEPLGLLSKTTLLTKYALAKRKPSHDETLSRFCEGLMGKKAAELFGDIAATTLFASSADKLSAMATLEALGADGSSLKSLTSSLSHDKPIFGFKNGMSGFIEALSNSFAFNKKTGIEVSKIRKNGQKWIVELQSGDTLEFDKVVLSTPSYVSARLLKEEDETLSELLKNIEYSPLAVVAVGYEKLDHQMQGYGIVSTKRSGEQALGITWDSTIFPEYALSGRKLLRVIIGGQRSPLTAMKEDSELLRIATGAISDMMGVYEEPMLNYVTKWHKAVPNYAPRHMGLVENIFKRVDNIRGLYLNSSAFKGISVEQCVKNSKECAIKIASE